VLLSNWNRIPVGSARKEQAATVGENPTLSRNCDEISVPFLISQSEHPPERVNPDSAICEVQMRLLAYNFNPFVFISAGNPSSRKVEETACLDSDDIGFERL